ncbi:rhodanese-like domain-containing protein [Thermodesulfobacteriota bacterium]
MKKFSIHILMTIVFSVIFCAGAGQSQQYSVDEENRQTIYRLYAEYKKEFPHVRDISVPESMELYKKGEAVFVDLRTPAEMMISTLPGAFSKDKYLKNRTRLAGKTVIVYCTISYRSGIFAMEMAEKGVTLHNLAGGLLAWVHEGGKVYNDKGETRRIHVYGDKWNYPPTGYEAVKFGFFERIFR